MMTRLFGCGEAIFAMLSLWFRSVKRSFGGCEDGGRGRDLDEKMEKQNKIVGQSGVRVVQEGSLVAPGLQPSGGSATSSPAALWSSKLVAEQRPNAVSVKFQSRFLSSRVRWAICRSSSSTLMQVQEATGTRKVGLMTMALLNRL